MRRFNLLTHFDAKLPFLLSNKKNSSLKLLHLFKVPLNPFTAIILIIIKFTQSSNPQRLCALISVRFCFFIHSQTMGRSLKPPASHYLDRWGNSISTFFHLLRAEISIARLLLITLCCAQWEDERLKCFMSKWWTLHREIPIAQDFLTTFTWTELKWTRRQVIETSIEKTGIYRAKYFLRISRIRVSIAWLNLKPLKYARRLTKLYHLRSMLIQHKSRSLNATNFLLTSKKV